MQELAFEAFREAMHDGKNLDRKDLDAAVLGSVPEYHKQRSLAGVVADFYGVRIGLEVMGWAVVLTGLAGIFLPKFRTA